MTLIIRIRGPRPINRRTVVIRSSHDPWRNCIRQERLLLQKRGDLMRHIHVLIEASPNRPRCRLVVSDALAPCRLYCCE